MNNLRQPDRLDMFFDRVRAFNKELNELLNKPEFEVIPEYIKTGLMFSACTQPTVGAVLNQLAKERAADANIDRHDDGSTDRPAGKITPG